MIKRLKLACLALLCKEVIVIAQDKKKVVDWVGKPFEELKKDTGVKDRF